MAVLNQQHPVDRPEVTAERIGQFERLLDSGVALDAAAGLMGLTPYVARLIRRHRRMPGAGPKRGNKGTHRPAHTRSGVEATTIRRIQRMLEVGWLEPTEIAREAGVSLNVVAEVATGRRDAISTTHATLDKGERFLARPVRCEECGGLISVLPCRVCRVERYARFACAVRMAVKTLWPKTDLTSQRISASMRSLSESISQGGEPMEKLLPMLADEVNGFFTAKDRREYAIRRAERLFDEVIEPLDIPGPDQVVDPLLRAAIRPLVGRIYDELTAKFGEDVLRN